MDNSFCSPVLHKFAQSFYLHKLFQFIDVRIGVKIYFQSFIQHFLCFLECDVFLLLYRSEACNLSSFLDNVSIICHILHQFVSTTVLFKSVKYVSCPNHRVHHLYTTTHFNPFFTKYSHIFHKQVIGVLVHQIVLLVRCCLYIPYMVITMSYITTFHPEPSYDLFYVSVTDGHIVKLI